MEVSFEVDIYHGEYGIKFQFPFFNVLACAIQDPATAAGSARGDKRLEHAARLLAKFG